MSIGLLNGRTNLAPSNDVPYHLHYRLLQMSFRSLFLWLPFSIPPASHVRLRILRISDISGLPNSVAMVMIHHQSSTGDLLNPKWSYLHQLGLSLPSCSRSFQETCCHRDSLRAGISNAVISMICRTRASCPTPPGFHQSCLCARKTRQTQHNILLQISCCHVSLSFVHGSGLPSSGYSVKLQHIFTVPWKTRTDSCLW